MVPRRKAVFSGCSHEIVWWCHCLRCVASRYGGSFWLQDFPLKLLVAIKIRAHCHPGPQIQIRGNQVLSKSKRLEMGAFKHLLDLECLTLELMEIFWLFVLGIPCLLLRSCISRSAFFCVGIKNCVKITHRQLVRLVSPHSWAGAHLGAEQARSEQFRVNRCTLGFVDGFHRHHLWFGYGKCLRSDNLIYERHKMRNILCKFKKTNCKRVKK